jgi:signal transduction histidine kinase
VALGDLVDATPTSAKLRVTAPLPDLSRPIEMSVYSFVADTIANSTAVGASRIDVSVDATSDRIIASTVDDGPGGASIVPGGSLAASHDRATALGGSLTVSSPRGGPTRVTLRLPITLGRA